MFEDSILESSPRWRTRRGWTTLASSALQAAALTLMVLVPVLRPDALPLLSGLRVSLPAPYQPGPATQPSGPAHAHPGAVVVDALVPPSSIPLHIYTGPDRSSPAPSGPATGSGNAWSCPSCPPGITSDMSSVFSPPPLLPHPPAPARRFSISGGVIEGYLVQQVQPVYPALAKLAGIQGDVILQAVIGRDGSIEQLHAVSGHPWLIPPALDAVRQWRYRPYLLNGQPVEVETQITVRFILSGR